MIKSVIFDCYGVLVVDSWIPFKQTYFSDDPDKLQAAQDLNTQLDRGFVSFPDFVKGAADLASLSVAETYTQLRQNPQNLELFQFITENLYGKYSIGLLSNAGENYLDTLFTPEQNALFDEIVLSCDIGAVKPDPKTYEVITTKLDVAPHEAIFVDDQQRYVQGAQDFGMRAVQYRTLQQTITDLGALL